MKHYEIVLLIHPDQNEQVSTMIERYRSLVESGEGKVHRLEEWGMRKLAYPIKRAYKAYYVLMNIECTQEALNELDDAFRFNDAVMRNMVLRRDKAITEVSSLLSDGSEDKGRDFQGTDTHKPDHRSTHKPDHRSTQAEDDGRSTGGE